jgi:hypothetical protein
LRQLDEATKIVAFWDGWLKTIDLVGSKESGFSHKDARKELAWVADFVTKLGSKTEYIRWRENLPWWKRLLLIYKPGRSTAMFKVYRNVYWGYVVLLPSYVILVFNHLHPKHGIRAGLTVLLTLLLILGAREVAMTAEVPKSESESDGLGKDC